MLGHLISLVQNDSVFCLILGLLNERVRVRLMAANKALASWQDIRRAAAHDAFERLKTELPKLKFHEEIKDARGCGTFHHNFTISLHEMDRGLLVCSRDGYYNGPTTVEPRVTYFAPWAVATVFLERINDRRIKNCGDASTNEKTLSSKLFEVSKRHI